MNAPARQDPYRKFWEQFEVARLEATKAGMTLRVAPDNARKGTGIEPKYVYEDDFILVRDEDVHRVRAQVPHAGVAGRKGDGQRVRKVPINVDTAAEARESVPVVIARVNEILGPGVASPNHVVSICPVNMCPADEPIPRPADTPPNPGRGQHGDGHGAEVLVIDTGLIGEMWDKEWLERYSWLKGVDGRRRDEPHTIGCHIEEYFGHGTFIAGVLRCVAPAAKLYVTNALRYAGCLPEYEFGELLLTTAETHDWPQIISLSAGVATHDGQPLLGLENFISRLRTDHPETLLVAAAGNDATDTKFWPAAHAGDALGAAPAVLSVGALSQDGQDRACFSNFGEWVKVFAPGDKLVNAFAVGELTYLHDWYELCNHDDETPCADETGVFSGMARWSGTSFATPVVAGMIAAHMSRTGNFDARLAAQELLADAEMMTIKGFPVPVLKPSTWKPVS